MYIVREEFIAKPGHAGELADMMKKEMASSKDFKGHVLLDMVTDYNKIVVEYEIDSLATFDKMMTDYRKERDAKKKKSNKPSRFSELYVSGKREIYRIV